MFNNWLKKYLEFGKEKLKSKKEPRNPLVKYTNKKKLSDVKRVRI